MGIQGSTASILGDCSVTNLARLLSIYLRKCVINKTNSRSQSGGCQSQQEIIGVAEKLSKATSLATELVLETSGLSNRQLTESTGLIKAQVSPEYDAVAIPKARISSAARS
jgi:hypothetical protein